MAFRIFFLTLFIFQQAHAAMPANQCEALLLSAEQRSALVSISLDEARQSAPIFQKLLLKAMKQPMKSRILKACESRGLCTQIDIAQAVRESVGGLGRNLKLARGYAIILGAWAGGLGFTVYLNTVKSVQLYAPVTALLTGVGLTWISAPVLSQVSSKVSRRVYSLLGLETGAVGSRASDGELESFYLGTQATIGPLAQIGGQRLNQFLDSLDKKVGDARVALRSGDGALAADQLAEIAVRMRELFPDVRPDHKAVARVVQTSFLNHVDINRTELRSAILERIRKLDDQAEHDSTRKYYEKIVATWFTEEDVRVAP